jgi:hypothetical protein
MNIEIIKESKNVNKIIVDYKTKFDIIRVNDEKLAQIVSAITAFVNENK